MTDTQTMKSSDNFEKNNLPKRASGVAKAALICSIVSLILLVALVFAGKNLLEKTRLAFSERIQQESTTLDMLKGNVTQSGDIYKDLKTRFDLVEEAQKEAASQRVALEEIYNSLLASKNDVSLSEIEQLVSIAKRQLFLLSNVKGAILALTQATDLLEKSEKPMMIRLKNGLEKDLAELKALPSQDLLQSAISLDSVVDEVETLPMLSSADASSDMTLAEMTEKEQSTSADEKVVDSTATNNTASKEPFSFAMIWHEFVSGTKIVWHDVKSLVEVTKVDSPEVLMLSERQTTDIRDTLRLSLLSARISLLSRHADLLKSDIARSEKLLKLYFDPKAAQVVRALEILEELKKLQLNLVLPELENTTAALRLALASASEGESK